MNKGVGNVLFNLFVCYPCITRCCCKKKFSKYSSSKEHEKDPFSFRHKVYSGVVFTYSWLYFIGAIFILPYLGQMFLNTLATATAVTIFIKRRELALHDFRTITGAFTPVVIFMSAYAVWSLRDTLEEDEDSSDTSDDSDEIKGFGLGVFLSTINGIWLIISTFFMCVIEDELHYFDSYFVNYDEESNVVSKTKALSSIAGAMVYRRVNGKKKNRGKDDGDDNYGPGRKKLQKAGKEHIFPNKKTLEKYQWWLNHLSLYMQMVHLIFGLLYICLCILFVRISDSLFTLELITYVMCFILGCVYFSYSMVKIRLKKYKKLSAEKQRLHKERVKTRKSLQVTELLTQMLILFLGISGTRILYALLANGIDFSNIFDLPGRIVAATILCWILLLYRTLEVVEGNLY